MTANNYDVRLDEILAKSLEAEIEWRSLCASTTDWAIYGAGRQGRKLARLLANTGKNVKCFIDANAATAPSCDGIEVVSLDDVPDSLKNVAIIVAIHNPGVSSFEIKSELKRRGFDTVLLLQQVVDTFPEIEHFWLAPREKTHLATEAIRECLHLLNDDASKQTFLDILSFRLLGDAPPFAEPDQYFPSSIPQAPSPLRLVDVGAFDGDTLDYIAGHAISMEWCSAFEPDPANFEKLVAKHKGPNLLIPCGVSNKVGIVRFQADGSSGKISGEAGEIFIQTITLDICLGNTPVNFIKMDIEGCELDALEGAQQTIRSFQPRLAIASYHHPAHMWEIPALMRRYGHVGKIMMRAHAENSFETVIYGV